MEQPPAARNFQSQSPAKYKNYRENFKTRKQKQESLSNKYLLLQVNTCIVFTHWDYGNNTSAVHYLHTLCIRYSQCRILCTMFSTARGLQHTARAVYDLFRCFAAYTYLKARGLAFRQPSHILLPSALARGNLIRDVFSP